MCRGYHGVLILAVALASSTCRPAPADETLRLREELDRAQSLLLQDQRRAELLCADATAAFDQVRVAVRDGKSTGEQELQAAAGTLDQATLAYREAVALVGPYEAARTKWLDVIKAPQQGRVADPVIAKSRQILDLVMRAAFRASCLAKSAVSGQPIKIIKGEPIVPGLLVAEADDAISGRLDKRGIKSKRFSTGRHRGSAEGIAEVKIPDGFAYVSHRFDEVNAGGPHGTRIAYDERTNTVRGKYWIRADSSVGHFGPITFGRHSWLSFNIVVTVKELLPSERTVVATPKAKAKPNPTPAPGEPATTATVVTIWCTGVACQPSFSYWDTKKTIVSFAARDSKGLGHADVTQIGPHRLRIQHQPIAGTPCGNSYAGSLNVDVAISN